MTRALARALLALSPALVLLVPTLRHLLESRMSLHMLLEFPWLMAAGWAAAGGLPARARTRLAALDALGLSSAVLASGVAAFWMIPAALDLALLEPPIARLKIVGWYVAGLMLAQGWKRLRGVPAAFFLGNTAWMLITAGLLYNDAESRLCVNYLFDEQALTGHGLVAWGLALGGCALLQLRPISRKAQPG